MLDGDPRAALYPRGPSDPAHAWARAGVPTHAMDYLIVVEARCYEVGPGRFVTESAFAEHLRRLRRMLGARFERIVVAAPSYSAEFYEANRSHLGELREEVDEITYLPLYREDASVGRYWTREAGRIVPALWRQVGRSSVVHSGLAHDVARPTPFLAILFAIVRRRPSIFFVDIDFRDKARMHRILGDWSARSYWICRGLLDPLRRIQVWLAVRMCSLCLLKSARLVADYGRGRPNVRDFFNTAHSAEHVISDARMAGKLERVRDPAEPLTLVYFGRFVHYKGLDRTLHAVDSARRRSGRPLRLLLIGDGDQRAALEQRIDALGAGDWATIREPIPFGPDLFERLYDCALAVGTPLVEDTPRAAFDAMAAGLPTVAFDIAYYRDLEETGAVVTSPWPDPEALAGRILELEADRERLADMAARAVAVARANTQEIWLERRVRWTRELLDAPAPA